MADLKQIAETLVNLTVKEVSELATIMKDEYGIEPAAAAVAVAGGAAAGGAAAFLLQNILLQLLLLLMQIPLLLLRLLLNYVNLFALPKQTSMCSLCEIYTLRTFRLRSIYVP